MDTHPRLRADSTEDTWLHMKITSGSFKKNKDAWVAAMMFQMKLVLGTAGQRCREMLGTGVA